MCIAGIFRSIVDFLLPFQLVVILGSDTCIVWFVKMLLFLPNVQKRWFSVCLFLCLEKTLHLMCVSNIPIAVTRMIFKKIWYSLIQQGSRGFDTCSLVRTQWISCKEDITVWDLQKGWPWPINGKTEDNAYNLDNIQLLLVAHVLTGCQRAWRKASNLFSFLWPFPQFLCLLWSSDFSGPKLLLS